MSKDNLQNRIKWRKIDLFKNIEILNRKVLERLKVLFNENNGDGNSNLDLYNLFVYC